MFKLKALMLATATSLVALSAHAQITERTIRIGTGNVATPPVGQAMTKLQEMVAAKSGGEFSGNWLPQMWTDKFGDSIWLRAGIGFVGGLLMAFGARMAGGCTSGHGISGTMQLNVASWIAVICFFIGGVVVANLLFRVGG